MTADRSTPAGRLQEALKAGYKPHGGQANCGNCASLRRASDGASACAVFRVHVTKEATCSRHRSRP